MLLAQIIESLASWMVNPWLFLAGALAVSVPIIIHLLNKRKFKVVDWAAMDFLLDADKKNRRRIRLENLLLLLLRCLAILLVAALLARPFIPTSVTAGLINAAQYERIVLLDDSLSMQVRLGNESAWDAARKRLLDLTNSLSQEQADNSLTLLLASRPERKLFHATRLTTDSIDDVNAEIERLEAGDGVAQLDVALKELEEHLSSQPANVNRVVYLFTDLRRRDWNDQDAGPESPAKKLVRLAKLTQGVYVIDAGTDEDRNLAITEIRPEGTLVQGVTSRFDVTIANHGATEARDLRVKFSAGDALPIESAIERLGAGETTSVRFNFTFSGEEEANPDQPLAPRQVKVELQTARQGEDDRLPADSLAFFPARLVRGIPALIVDGDPSAEFGKAESFYLRRALAPIGPVPSGVAAEVVTESELESLDLTKYQVIFLANVYRLGDKTADNIEKLEKWVAAGGGLVLLPGDQIDEQFYSDFYFRDGAGLSPVLLTNIRGDETEATWASLRIEDAQHEVFQTFAGQNNPLLDAVKVFRWWGSTIKKEQLGKEVSLLAKFSDVEESPAIVEKTFGQGHVMAFAIPADADWHNWTSDPSFLLVAQELVRHMAGDRGDAGALRVGQPIRQPLDLALYGTDATLAGPKELKANLQAFGPDANEGNAAGQQTVWQLEYPQASAAGAEKNSGVAAQGFYDLKLTRRDGSDEHVLFAANVDPAEGNLTRADRATLDKEFAGSNVRILTALSGGSLADAGSQTEIWWYLLWALVGILCAEQLLGWFFGWGR
ncbi:MAG: BatA domain-containing protein [Pirellulaceae bacterium]|nr:BatA domain-containing protein [Pirellulaceae bacterium]